MVNIIKAEHQKAKRTMRKKFIWGFPLLTFVMAFIFTLRLPIYYRQRCGNITNQNLVCTCFCNPYANDVPVASCFTKWTCRRSRESSFGYGSHCSGNVSLNHLVCFCNGSVFEMV